MNHEFQTHRIDIEWRCSLCAKTFNTTALLREHIVNTHKEDFELSQIEEVIAASKRLLLRHSISELCPFCQTVPSESQRGFASHVGRHLQEISLAALPALDLYTDGSSSDDNDAEERDDDYDENAERSMDDEPIQLDQSHQSLRDPVSSTDLLPASTKGLEQPLKVDAREANEVSPDQRS